MEVNHMDVADLFIYKHLVYKQDAPLPVLFVRTQRVSICSANRFPIEVASKRFIGR